MSLSRAFTTRKAKVAEMGDSPPPHRSNSARDRHHGPILRHKISGPIQLVHTTNMLSYNAPDIPSPHASLRNKSSLRSVGEDSEAPSTTESTPPTSPEVSPMEDCPGPVPNHLSTYFSVSGKPHVMPPAMPKVNEAPAIPQRSPSHTKQNSYEAIARQRSVSQRSRDSEHSVSTKASYTFSRSSSTSTRASSASYVSAGHGLKAPPVPAPAVPVAAPAPPPSFQQRALKDSHPFGHELAQVTELAEEYSARPLSKEEEEDNRYIKSKGLNKFSAEDYLGDVQNLIFSFFPEVSHAKPTTPQWI
ncbi:hypothetical protein NXS19_000547 [Fusarium pseudograminearum]|uniref:Uncharacterized protein n=1 Tax=Fusarium pseudograminearum (strain CS3096) TaxID=1028729 RepID=K3UYG5_FUSPC|nr:hypothetical protein FPSE_02035 [Fusarium pseudograminearum CS3096]EKJ77801.1 hypothetical protein FPSE_02035 [Fusarium pseudograminearum CS3096]KAF0637980.1 hypothetical protein FPSE5266_02035 [Fusarium pseudograminearum]QPC74925.1 hypothetical protein HYE68_005677 [Fusarium pseudograminearum]UZP32731.1 hypothetical protein NXS19_000547 [Fusarium pseudograminearum]